MTLLKTLINLDERNWKRPVNHEWETILCLRTLVCSFFFFFLLQTSGAKKKKENWSYHDYGTYSSLSINSWINCFYLFTFTHTHIHKTLTNLLIKQELESQLARIKAIHPLHLILIVLALSNDISMTIMKKIDN